MRFSALFSGLFSRVAPRRATRVQPTGAEKISSAPETPRVVGNRYVGVPQTPPVPDFCGRAVGFFNVREFSPEFTNFVARTIEAGQYDQTIVRVENMSDGTTRRAGVAGRYIELTPSERARFAREDGVSPSEVVVWKDFAYDLWTVGVVRSRERA